MTEISKLPETAARLLLIGMLPVTSTQAELEAFRDAEIKTTSELIKLATLAAAMAGALRERGTPEPAASLAAEAGMAVFRIAFERCHRLHVSNFKLGNDIAPVHQ